MTTKDEAEPIIKAFMWKAERLEAEALDASESAAEILRADAQFFREKISQIRGERIPLRDDKSRQYLVLQVIAEYSQSRTS